ncbi:MAG: hypothetical protein WC393_05305 [Candidatus Nanoarchaeia archaeon]|jgi:hypothetical protein
MSTECENKSIVSKFKVIADNYKSFISPIIKDPQEFSRIDILVSNVNYHNNNINSLNELYKNNPSEELEKTISTNAAFMKYYMKRTVALYSRFFINMTK